jgi:flagellar motor switch protein FliM
MTKTMTTDNVYTFDRRLLARMTGMLGDDKTIGRICADLGQVLGEFLPDLLHSETGLDLTIAYAGFDTGPKSELIARLGDGVALSDCLLRNWCSDFTISCDSPAVITMMEMLLGSPADIIEEPKPRNLSAIELNVAAIVFETVAGVLKSAVNASGGFEPNVGKAYNAEARPAPDANVEDVYAACINITLGVGPVLSTFSILVPQQTLLKTTINFPKGIGQGRRQKNAWAEQVEQQVRRSMVELQAHIKLEELTLSAISRLQAGDVIAFKDPKDVRVEVKANGRDLYVCEFGRSGARYTVRIKDTHGSEDDLLHHLTR